MSAWAETGHEISAAFCSCNIVFFKNNNSSSINVPDLMAFSKCFTWQRATQILWSPPLCTTSNYESLTCFGLKIRTLWTDKYKGFKVAENVNPISSIDLLLFRPLYIDYVLPLKYDITISFLSRKNKHHRLTGNELFACCHQGTTRFKKEIITIIFLCFSPAIRRTWYDTVAKNDKDNVDYNQANFVSFPSNRASSVTTMTIADGYISQFWFWWSRNNLQFLNQTKPTKSISPRLVSQATKENNTSWSCQSSAPTAAPQICSSLTNIIIRQGND